MMSIRFMVLFLGLLLGVQSQECTPPGDDYYFNVTDQNYINALSSSCTTMIGTLRIARSFTGPFYLPNITNITGQIDVDWWGLTEAPNITTIELPDLQYLERDIFMKDLADRLERLSLPKLEYTRGVTLVQYIDNAEFDLQALKKSEYLSVKGNYSKISLDSLQNVTDRLSICNTNHCGLGYHRGEGPRRAMNVSLPSFVEVGDQATIAGDVSSLAMPEFSQGSLRVFSKNTPVRFDFPQLTHVNYALDLQGNISSLSLPRLEEVASILSIQSSYPLNVYLPLVKARLIYLDGEIEDASFPNLNNASSLYINSTLPIDCGKLTDAINGTYNGPGKDKYWLTCYSAREESSELSTKAKVAIGVVVGVVGLGLIIGLMVWRKKRSSKKRKAIGESGSAIELTTFGTGRREDRGQGQSQGQRHGQAHGEAEGENDPPPPYSPRE